MNAQTKSGKEQVTVIYCDKDLVLRWVPEFPEAPASQRDVTAEYAAAMVNYNEVLKKVKETSIFFEDQAKIKTSIYSQLYFNDRTDEHITDYLFHPDMFYTLSGVEVETVEICSNDNKACSWAYCQYCEYDAKKVARLIVKAPEGFTTSEDNGEWNATPKKKVPLEVRLERIGEKLRNRHAVNINDYELHEAYLLGKREKGTVERTDEKKGTKPLSS